MPHLGAFHKQTSHALLELDNRQYPACYQEKGGIINYFDVETVPMDAEDVERMMPTEIKNPVMPEDLRHPVIPDFEHKGLKDQAKILEWKADKERDWKQKHAEKINKWNAEAMEKRSKFHEQAALFAETCNIAVIGYGYSGQSLIQLAVNKAITPPGFLNVKKDKDVKIIEFTNEKRMLEDWIDTMTDKAASQSVAGFAIKHFDLPLIRKRCWLNGIPFPRALTYGRVAGYMWDDIFVDLQEVWASGDRTVRISQDYLSSVFSLPSKPSDGALFWKLLRDDPAAAFQYAAHDIRTIVTLGTKMGIDRVTEGLGLPT